MRIITDDGGGVTRISLKAWRDNRQLFGTFIEARVYGRKDKALEDGRSCRLGGGHIYSPTMVLIDERGDELWLFGTPCGYTGEGSTGAETILRGELFGDAAMAVFDRRFVRVVLRKGENGITSSLTERDHTLWGSQVE